MLLDRHPRTEGRTAGAGPEPRADAAAGTRLHRELLQAVAAGFDRLRSSRVHACVVFHRMGRRGRCPPGGSRPRPVRLSGVTVRSVDPLEIVARVGGACRCSDLLGAGVTRRALAASVRRGDLVRHGRSGLALPGAPSAATAAVAHRSALACVSAVAAQGLPLLVTPALPHLSSTSHRTRPGYVWHRSGAVAGSAVPLPTAVAQVARCRPPAEGLAAVDAALRSGRVTDRELTEQLTTRERGSLRWVLGHADARAESVLESALRAILLCGAVGGLQLQALLDGIGRVDVLVDGWLIVEADGFEFHSGRSDYRTDRRRAAAAVVHGYLTLRFGYEDIVSRPGAVLETVRAALARRRASAFATAH